ncbi:MAG: MBL fold metallo-hydrolase [Thermomicrobiales bacterium]
MGYLLEVDGLKIWDVADTEYDARLRPLADENIDVMIVPINGVGGNLTAHEAALLTWYVEPKVVIPMHYNMWTPEGFGPGATLDPLSSRPPSPSSAEPPKSGYSTSARSRSSRTANSELPAVA